MTTGAPPSYFGFTNLDLEGRRIEFPRDVVLESTFAHLMSPMIMAFAPSTGGPHPGPWKPVSGGFGADITAQLYVPESAANGIADRMELAATVLFLIRLWSDPAVTMAAASNLSFRELRDAPDNTARIVPLEFQPRYFVLGNGHNKKSAETIDWVAEHFETTVKLRAESSEFRLASYALDTGQFVQNTALTLISLWGALEALFSPSTSELKFRVSALIAAYLHPPGSRRRKLQQTVASLYDKRSAAAHGKPKHASDDLLATFELLRTVLVRIISDGAVSTKEQLEDRLFS